MSEATDYAAIPWNAWQPVDRATLLFVVKEAKILLIHKKRGLGKGKINGPGGRMEPGETPEEAAVREVEEELLTTPLQPVPKGILRFQFVDGYSLEVYVFIAPDCDRTPAETEEALPEWFPLDEIPYARMWADDILWLPRMLDGECFSGWFLFEHDRMCGHRLKFAPDWPTAEAFQES